MADYTQIASYDVRRAIWRELQSNKLLLPNDYYADGFIEPLIPIIPAQQVPEFNNLLPGKTFIIYDTVMNNMGVEWWMSEETMTLEIVSTSTQEIQTIANFLIDVFRRYDLSAREVNLSLVPGSPFTFHYFHIDSADTIQSFQNEGGFMSGIVNFTYTFTRETDPNTGRYL
jgi:hypothetical protein